MGKRTERDSLGEIEVDGNRLYGASTMRSWQNFPIGEERMPYEIILSLVVLKKCAAIANSSLGVIDQKSADLIIQACEEIRSGQYKQEFPLNVWQTGSGTHTNMNVNEVIANVANRASGSLLGSKEPIHPNDHVNASQSSNDIFPTAMHIAAYSAMETYLFPSLEMLLSELEKKSEMWNTIIKTGRTHLMDAVPLTLGQEFSGYAAQVKSGIEFLKGCLPSLAQLALGATAVGTGLNAPKGFAKKVIEEIVKETELPFIPTTNSFQAIASHDALVEVSSALKRLATSLYKISCDLRLLGSGPRTGLGELFFPANEPGSSIMPGKVNPTQCEALCQVAIQVIANDLAITMANSQGHLELNTYKPLIAYNLLQSIQLLSDACICFKKYFLEGLVPNQEKIKEYLDSSLMLATALNPHLGYDKTAQVVKKAYNENITLKKAALALGFLTEDQFDQFVDPSKMV